MENAPIKLFCRGCGQKLDVSSLEPFSKIPCPVCQTPIRIPMPFGRYLLEKICGIGGMSKVYRAIDTQETRRVAVKILDDEFEDSHSNGIPFEHEAKLVQKVNHPGVIPVYDYGIYNEQAFMVMKYMAKGSLEYYLNNKILPTYPILMGWLSTIAEGLQAAYSCDVIHHDIKPGNILIDAELNAALGDFDLAELHQYGDNQNIAEWVTPGYASPERLHDGEEDWRGDIFSFGVTTYELITGNLPFGNHGEVDELYERRQTITPPEPRELNSEVSPKFSKFLLQMMAFRPEDRPSYEEIVKAFAQEVPKGSLQNRVKDWFGRR